MRNLISYLLRQCHSHRIQKTDQDVQNKLCPAMRQVYCHHCCHQLACMWDKHFKVSCQKMFRFVTAYQAGSGQSTRHCTWNYMKCGKYIKVSIDGTHSITAFACLIEHFSQAACNDHRNHHSSLLGALAANMKSTLDDFIRALPVESRLFSDPCNEIIGKRARNGCQEQSSRLVLWTPKMSFMMIHLNIILKPKHGFAGLFPLLLFSWLNYFSLHLQVKRLIALNMHAKTEISFLKSQFWM